MHTQKEAMQTLNAWHQQQVAEKQAKQSQVASRLQSKATAATATNGNMIKNKDVLKDYLDRNGGAAMSLVNSECVCVMSLVYSECVCVMSHVYSECVSCIMRVCFFMSHVLRCVHVCMYVFYITSLALFF
jgi:hypothetical protein